MHARNGEVAPPGQSRLLVYLTLLVLLFISGGTRLERASRGLNAGAHFDERFTLQNIVRLIAAGDIEPRHAYYGSLSYLPQAALLAASEGLHRLTGIRALAIFGERRDFAHLTPTAYFLGRAVNVGFGVASLWLLFALGRRVDSPEVGLLAAAILAAAPRHAVSSAHLKPDILVLLLTLAAFWLALDAAAAGPETERRRFAWAGVGVGLAMSAKLTGVVAALPVAAAALFGARPRRTVFVRWLVSGFAAAATFVVLNPYLGKVWAALRQNAGGYAVKGTAAAGDGPLFVAGRAAEFLWRQHGAVVVVLVALGLVAVGAHALSRRTEGPERAGAALLAILVVVWSAVVALMPLFRAQNYLPVLPLTALAAAWGAAILWRAGLPGRPALFRFLVLGAVAVLIFAQVREMRAGAPDPTEATEFSRLDTA